MVRADPTRTGRRRAAAPIRLAAGVLAALAAFGAARAQDAPVVHQVVVADRAVAGETVVRVLQDDRVELRWTTDEAAEVHLHGYDVVADLVPGETATLAFDAHATGRFPVTAHGFGAHHGDGGGHDEDVLLYVEVHPR